MDTFEAKNLLADSLRCLARNMEQIRLREIDKVRDDDEPMQDFLAECCCTLRPHEGSSAEDCIKYLDRLYKGFQEASEHTILMNRKYESAELDKAHLCDIIFGGIGHGFPKKLMRCASKVNDLANELIAERKNCRKSNKMRDRVVGSFVTRAEKMIDKYGYKDWEDGHYSLSLGYLASWMQRKYWNE